MCVHVCASGDGGGGGPSFYRNVIQSEKKNQRKHKVGGNRNGKLGHPFSHMVVAGKKEGIIETDLGAPCTAHTSRIEGGGR